VRLAGCNLRCSYCDTVHAWEGGDDRDVAAVVAEARRARVQVVEITGGEPLLQEGFVPLARELRDGCGCPVIVETNGSLDIGIVPDRVAAIVDVKCPGSGECDRMRRENLEVLRGIDEVKFVVTDRDDFDWARRLIAETGLQRRCRAVYLSPARDRLEPAELASWIVAENVPARLQVQLHKLLGLR